MRPFQPQSSIEPGDSWYVQLDGEPVALIDQPADDDMFWFRWRLSPLFLNEIPPDLWDYGNDSRRSFRHCETGEVDPHVIPAGPDAAYKDGRVLLRGPHKSGPRIQRVFR